MTDATKAPASVEEFRAAVLARYDGLSKRLQQIARYVLDEPNQIALETLAVVAERCGVQPSAIVRFAKTFGFDGAMGMQKLFRDSLLSNYGAAGYGERVRQFTDEVNRRAAGGPGAMLSEFVEGNSLALTNLSQTVSEKEMAAAVRLIGDAETVYVVGYRRSFPVAAYLTYSLLQAKKRTFLVDGVGGLARLQLETSGPNDLLIAISYQPYADETVQVVAHAMTSGTKLLAISDSLVSPIAQPASLVLQVRESEIRKFRSLAASMCLAQALAISYVFESTQGQKPVRKSPGIRKLGAR